MTSYRDVKSRKAVLAAIEECDLISREEFRAAYGFGASDTYFLRHKGEEYDSKPIIAVAYKHQYPDEPALENAFSGGRFHAGRHLARLGFRVDGVKLPATDWSLAEVEIIVSEYFDQLRKQLRGEKVDRSARDKDLRKKLPRRNASSVSQKKSNITAVLQSLELPWLDGFKPRKRKQLLLEAVVLDWLADHPDLFAMAPKSSTPTPSSEAEVPPPPNARLRPVERARRAVRVDFAGLDEKNRELGHSGEKWALQYLKQELAAAGRADLAKKVRWVSKDLGDGLGYDILSYTVKGEAIQVEVKTTSGGYLAPFLLTLNEISTSRHRNFVLFRLFNFTSEPKFYRLSGDMKAKCQLIPVLFRALPKRARS